MVTTRTITVDGNEAAAAVAYRLSDLAAVSPITPATSMCDLVDEWAARGCTNAFGAVPTVVQMQAAGGAAGAIHGALQTGALATTFTASQDLLQMIPTLYRLAGELQPFVAHVAARAVTTHAQAIGGDHSDVMACRQTGVAMLCASSVQEAQDMACVAHLATLRAKVPFVHFFDGFRTSHEIAKITALDDDDLRALVDGRLVAAQRRRALTPDHPTLRGAIEGADVFFQAREAGSPFHDACPAIVSATMAAFAARTGRSYRPFEYHGHPEAERVVVAMGSACETLRGVATHLVAAGERVGVLQVRLYRPFATELFLAALPTTARRVAVLDRTKEPGAPAEPLCLDVLAAVRMAAQSGARADDGLHVVGGRFGLAGKEFSPGMALAVFAMLAAERPRRGFTIGIVDDVSGTSLEYDPGFELPRGERTEAICFGLGADGTAGSCRGSLRILADTANRHVQGWFEYDSRKVGAMTASHLRFGPEPFEAPYPIRRADLVACHRFDLLERPEVLAAAAPGATLLLNAPFAAEEIATRLSARVREQIRVLGLRLSVIDAGAVAAAAGIGDRVDTILQTCFFALADVLPRAVATERIKALIRKHCARAGEELVRRNCAAVDAALEHHRVVTIDDVVGDDVATVAPAPPTAAASPDTDPVIAALLAGDGDRLPSSAFQPDGSWPTATARLEKRGLAAVVPIWDPLLCTQCNLCALMCPHAALRAKVYPTAALAAAPTDFPSQPWQGDDFPDHRYTLQVAPEDCTGCGLCVEVCPTRDKARPRHKAIDMTPLPQVRERERGNFEFFLGIADVDRARVDAADARSSQLLRPLFEFPGACAGCGETPYLKLLTQLFGDRLLIANATGCSAAFGGALPTTPYAVDAAGRGPAWCHAPLENSAEFGLGMRLAVDGLTRRAHKLLHALATALESDTLIADLLEPAPRSERWLAGQRERVTELRRRLAGLDLPEARELDQLADHLVPKSVWVVGGDGWAFDAGFGGLDHVLSSEHDVNVLVLDTEVRSNTGGQATKATPLGAAAKFAARGRSVDKKDLGLMAIHYGHVFVGGIAIGAEGDHAVRVLRQAEAHPGPSLVIAYSPCIAHGYDLAFGADQQRRAVQCGIWPLFHYDPTQVERGAPPLRVDEPGNGQSVAEYMRNEARFRLVERVDPAGFRRHAAAAQLAATRRMAIYHHISRLRLPMPANSQPPAPPRQ